MSEEGPASRLMVLMFTDLAGSVDLKTRLGNAVYVRLIARHDRIFKEVMHSVPGAEIHKDTGDGFLARFGTASDAVGAALRFQWAIRQEPWEPEPLSVRIGLHIGEVMELIDTGVNPKLVGLAADFAARIMDLAQPGQVLMTRTLFNDARQYLREHPPVGFDNEHPEIEWMAHGPYVFKGSDEPVDVFEVGAVGIGPLRRPPDSEKARRAVTPEEEELFGWRPANGAEVPSRDNWILDRQLGEGGFGEVWRATHAHTKMSHVFKFCYDAERLRSFKRELTLFRLLRETLGERRDIVKLHEVRLDQPPYFLESEYSRDGDLSEWSATQGGIDQVPLRQRIDIVARTADAVEAAHSVGILHKDIKPSNILIVEGKAGPRPCLADFGIGGLADTLGMEQFDFTVLGFTRGLPADQTQSGTRVYQPPETFAGGEFTVQGDVYALGVLLYQMVIGDLRRPLAHGWKREVEDELLREDIEACVYGDPARRMEKAGELAKRLHSLESRRRAAAEAASTPAETPAPEPEKGIEEIALGAPTYVKLKCGKASGREGKVMKLMGRKFTFGRFRGCSIHTNSDLASRRHARLRLVDGKWVLKDLESSNGTYVNRLLIRQADLRIGDRISLGSGGAEYVVLGLETGEAVEDLEATRLVSRPLQPVRPPKPKPKSKPKFQPKPGPVPPKPKPRPRPQPKPRVVAKRSKPLPPPPGAPARKSGFPWLAAAGLLFGFLTGLTAWGAEFPYKPVAAPGLWMAKGLSTLQPEWVSLRPGWVVSISLAIYGALVGFALRRPLRRFPLLFFLATCHLVAALTVDAL